MIAADGILTARGGKTSHAAVVARGMGKTCVVRRRGARRRRRAAQAVARRRRHRARGRRRSASTARPARCSSARCRSCRRRWRPTSRTASTPRWTAPTRRPPRWCSAVDRLLAHADDTPPAARARQRRHRRGRRPGPHAGRAGHRPVPHRAHVPRRPPRADRAGHPRRRPTTSATPRSPRCCRCSARTSSSCSSAMDGLPVTIRLLDPPLHEFLPDLTELSVKVARRRGARATPTPPTLQLLAAVERLHESNPMLGLRGVRLGLVVPGPVRAAGAGDRRGGRRAGSRPAATRRSEIMVPLVGSVMELHLVARRDRRHPRRGRRPRGRRRCTSRSAR